MRDEHGSGRTILAATVQAAMEQVEREARQAVLRAVQRRGLAIVVISDAAEVRRCCGSWTPRTFAGAWPFLHLFLAHDMPTPEAPGGRGADFVERELLPGWPLPRAHWHPMPLVPESADAPARLERTIRMVCELPPPALPRFDLVLESAASLDAWPTDAGAIARRVTQTAAAGLAMSAELLAAAHQLIVLDAPAGDAEIRWRGRRRLVGSNGSTVRVLVGDPGVA